MMRTELGQIGLVSGLPGPVGGGLDLPREGAGEGFAALADAPQDKDLAGKDRGAALLTAPDAMSAWVMIAPAMVPLPVTPAPSAQGSAGPAEAVVLAAEDAASLLAADDRVVAGGDAKDESPDGAFAENAAAPDARFLPSSTLVGPSGAADRLPVAASGGGKSAVVSSAAADGLNAVELPASEAAYNVGPALESLQAQASPLALAAGRTEEGGAASPLISGEGGRKNSLDRATLSRSTAPLPTPEGGWPPARADGAAAPAAPSLLPATPPTSGEAIATHRPVLVPGPANIPAGGSEPPLGVKAAAVPDSTPAPILQATPAAPLSPPGTTAERAWLGLHGVEPKYGRGKEGAALPASGESPEKAARNMRPDPAAPVPAKGVLWRADPTHQAADAGPASVQLDPELASLGWSPAGQQPATASPSVASLPPATVPQLAAGIVATLHRQAAGTTEIALSPAELGGVRLRLEADARDPDRMIIHLTFDRPETMDLFRRHADQLSEAIRAAGYSEARLDFGQSGTGANARSDGQATNDAGAAPNLGGQDHTDAPPPDRPLPLRLADMAGLDLRL